MKRAILRAKRERKNKDYPDIVVLVREATSNDPLGASEDLIHAIGAFATETDTYPRMFGQLWRRLLDIKHKQHISKALTLLDALLQLEQIQVQLVFDVRDRIKDVKILTGYACNKGVHKGADVRALAAKIYEFVMRYGEDRDPELALHRERLAAYCNRSLPAVPKPKPSSIVLEEKWEDPSEDTEEQRQLNLIAQQKAIEEDIARRHQLKLQMQGAPIDPETDSESESEGSPKSGDHNLEFLESLDVDGFFGGGEADDRHLYAEERKHEEDQRRREEEEAFRLMKLQQERMRQLLDAQAKRAMDEETRLIQAMHAKQTEQAKLLREQQIAVQNALNDKKYREQKEVEALALKMKKEQEAARKEAWRLERLAQEKADQEEREREAAKRNKLLSQVSAASAAIKKKSDIERVKRRNSEEMLATGDSEVRAYAKYFNLIFKTDPMLEDAADSIDFLCKLSNGWLLAFFINYIAPGTIDVKKSLKMPPELLEEDDNSADQEQMDRDNMVNNRVVVNAAVSLGVAVKSLKDDPSPLCLAYLSKYKHLALSFVWSLVSLDLMSRINVRWYPQLAVLKQEKESKEAFGNLPPEKILLRWLQYHLERTPFGKQKISFTDGQAYSHLLNRLRSGLSPSDRDGRSPAAAVKVISKTRRASSVMYTCTISQSLVALAADKQQPEQQQQDKTETQAMWQRVISVVQQASAMGVLFLIDQQAIVSGNPRLNLAFTASIFNACIGLDEQPSSNLKAQGWSEVTIIQPEEVKEEESSEAKSSEGHLTEVDVEQEKWCHYMMHVDREEVMFANWINSLELQGVPTVKYLMGGVLGSGLVFLHLLDHVRPGIVDWKKVELGSSRHHRVSNANYAVQLGKDMDFVLSNTGGADLVDGNRVLTLGFLWQIMRADMLKSLAALECNIQEMPEADFATTSPFSPLSAAVPRRGSVFNVAVGNGRLDANWESKMLWWSKQTVKRAQTRHSKLLASSGPWALLSSFSDPRLKDVVDILALMHAVAPTLMDWSSVLLENEAGEEAASGRVMLSCMYEEEEREKETRLGPDGFRRNEIGGDEDKKQDQKKTDVSESAFQRCMFNAGYLIRCARKLGCLVFFLPEDVVQVSAIMCKVAKKLQAGGPSPAPSLVNYL